MKDNKEKNKGGRPRKEIDYKTLDSLCAIQCTGEECAAILGMSYELLNNRLAEDGNGGFLDYFKQKSANGKASLRRRQWKTAMEDGQGSVTMQIWLGKQWLGQCEPKDKPPEQANQANRDYIRIIQNDIEKNSE